MRYQVITAEYVGNCDGCDEPVYAGEPVYWAPPDRSRGETRGTILCQRCYGEME